MKRSSNYGILIIFITVHRAYVSIRAIIWRERRPKQNMKFNMSAMHGNELSWLPDSYIPCTDTPNNNNNNKIIVNAYNSTSVRFYLRFFVTFYFLSVYFPLCLTIYSRVICILQYAQVKTYCAYGWDQLALHFHSYLFKIKWSQIIALTFWRLFCVLSLQLLLVSIIFWNWAFVVGQICKQQWSAYNHDTVRVQ